MARGATWDPALERARRRGDRRARCAPRAAACCSRRRSTSCATRAGAARRRPTARTRCTSDAWASAFIRGAQQHVIASAKHFAVNSIENTRLVVDVTVDERTLREIYLPHFRMAVQRRARRLGDDRLQQGERPLLRRERPPAARHPEGRLGLSRASSSPTGSSARTAPAVGPRRPRHRDAGAGLLRRRRSVAAVEDGERADSAAIDDAVRRILRAKFCFRLDSDPPVPGPDRVREPGTPRPGARGGARGDRAAEERAAPRCRSIARAIRSLVVVGSLADIGQPRRPRQQRGGALVRRSTPLDGIRALRRRDRGEVRPRAAALRRGSGSGGRRPTPRSSSSGSPPEDEGESGLVTAGDRLTLDLATEQEQLIAAIGALNPRTIVVLEGGSAIDDAVGRRRRRRS